MDRDDDIWERMLLWTSERTGLPTATIERILQVQSEFWETHYNLSEQFMSPDEDD